MKSIILRNFIEDEEKSYINDDYENDLVYSSETVDASDFFIHTDIVDMEFEDFEFEPLIKPTNYKETRYLNKEDF